MTRLLNLFYRLCWRWRFMQMRRAAASFSATTAETILSDLPWWTLNLPTPPSVNRFVAKLGNKSPIVKAWIRQADMTFVLARLDTASAMYMGTSVRKFTRIVGPFEAEFTFKRDKSDFHNRLKPLFDWLQRVELIRNDRDCERLTAAWGESIGVTVRLRPWVVMK